MMKGNKILVTCFSQYIFFIIIDLKTPQQIYNVDKTDVISKEKKTGQNSYIELQTILNTCGKYRCVHFSVIVPHSCSDNY